MKRGNMPPELALAVDEERQYAAFRTAYETIALSVAGIKAFDAPAHLHMPRPNTLDQPASNSIKHPQAGTCKT
jgi:hypothetical protein